jgi:DUF4097 and DUF4098 domain-containing protein YvlB
MVLFRPAKASVLLQTVFVLAFASGGCIDLVGSDLNRYVEREEKHFSMSGTPEVALSTFDGSIEVRPWDKAEVQVVIEKRAPSKDSAATIQVRADQSGDRVTVEVTVPKGSGFGFHFGASRSAKLIVMTPANANVAARSGDGSIDIERIAGRFDLKTGDGSIRARDIHGDVKAHTGDGSIRLEGVDGGLDVDTGDGSVVVSGTMTSVRAHSGDGTISIRADAGSAAKGEWDITTGDGSVTVELPDEFNGELDAHTGDGRIHVDNVTLSNVTGPIDKNTVKGRLGSGGRSVRVRTGDGSITLTSRAGRRS